MKVFSLRSFPLYGMSSCFKSCSIKKKIVALATSAPEPQKRTMALVTYQKWKTNMDQKVPDSHMVGRIVMKLWCANSKISTATRSNFSEQWLLQFNLV